MFQSYKEIVDKRLDNISRSDLRDTKEDIMNNFAEVKVMLERLNVLEITDSKVLTTPQVMSQLGGVLNLWAGITVFLAVELLELFYRLLCLYFKWIAINLDISVKNKVENINI